MLPYGDVGIGGPLRHSCGALDSRRAWQPLADAKDYSRIDTHKPSRCRGLCFVSWRLYSWNRLLRPDIQHLVTTMASYDTCSADQN